MTKPESERSSEHAKLCTRNNEVKISVLFKFIFILKLKLVKFLENASQLGSKNSDIRRRNSGVQVGLKIKDFCSM